MGHLPINDLSRHFNPLRDELSKAVQRVLERGWFVLGPEVKAFEQEFREVSGTQHVISVANGTDSLEICLRSLGVSANDSVATVANAGAYSTVAIRSVGAIPVYVDIDPYRLTMSPQSLQAKLRSQPTRAIVVTHLYGRMADMPSLMEIADRFGIPVVEDCAQSHGARLDGRYAGSWSDVSSFSFYPTKNLGALGDGGAIATNRQDVADAARELRQYGWSTKYRSTRSGGRNSRLDEIQAAVLRVMLPKLDLWNKRRREIAHIYGKMLANTGVLVPRLQGDADVVHLYMIRSEERDIFKAALAKHGISSDIHYPLPDYMQEGFQISPIPVLPATEAACSSLLTLPCFPEMTDAEVQEVAAIVISAAAGGLRRAA